MLCVCHTTPTLKLLCLHVFRQAGSPQREDCLALRWEIALSVFPKDTATRYSIGSRTKVLQPFRERYSNITIQFAAINGTISSIVVSHIDCNLNRQKQSECTSADKNWLNQSTLVLQTFEYE